MPRRILVSGGAGFIGSAVVRHIVRHTRDVVLVVDKLTYAGRLESLSSVVDSARFSFARADVADANKMRDVVAGFRPDVIMHLAAESHVDRSIEEPSAFLRTNVTGTFTLLQAALEHWRTLPAQERSAFRFHHISTDEVFGSLGPEGLFDEMTPYRPNSPYSATKAAADHLVRAWHHTYGLPTILSNCSNNYGPYQFPEKLIPLMILNALENKPLPVYGDGKHVRDWLYVDDHARALVLLAEAGVVGETYNVGGSAERSNLEVVRQISATVDQASPDAAAGGRDRLITLVPDRPGHDLRYAVDASKIRRELGWRPQETFDSGLEKTVRWYIDNRWWWHPIRSGVYGGERLGRAVVSRS